MRKPLLVIFDGNAIVHRAYHAFQTTRPLTLGKTGEVISAVYGFAQMLIKTLNELKPTHCAIAFDKKGPTFRHELFDQYKAHRPATPDELLNQLGRVRQVVEAFNIPIYEVDGYEADDVLGTLSRQASEQGIDTVIVTGDADTMQLVSPQVNVLYPKPGRSFSDTMLYDESAVKEKYGVGPEYIADYKGLVGDPSDNIPGVRGIGEKTAVKLIQQFGSIEQIYEHINEVTPPHIQTKLRENEAVARQSKELAMIITKVPVKLSLDERQRALYDRDRVAELFRELGFYSLLSRLPKLEEEATEEKTVAPAQAGLGGDYRTIKTTVDFEDLLRRLAQPNSFAFDLATTGPDAISAVPVGIALSPAAGEAYYIPVGAELPPDGVINKLKPFLQTPAIAKIAHDGKFDMAVLAGLGIPVSELNFDTMVAAYLLGEKALTLKALAFSRLGIEIASSTELTGAGAKQLSMSLVDVERVVEYACAAVDVTMRLAGMLETDLRQQGLWQLFAEVEMPLVPVLVHMERSGVALDTKLFREMSRELGDQLLKLEVEIYNSIGHQFNINSPQQLGAILFGELKLPTSRKGKNRYSTEASILEELRGVHPVIQLILDYRQLTKLKSTYIDALPGLINEKTGRLHTSFNQTRTATGRLSSSEPNLQNIPIRGELGKQVRRAFVAPPGYYLLAADYSQIDLRALAHLSQDPGLLSAFQRNEDIHAATAAQLFGVAVSSITPDMRRLAKTVNFGVIYGMSDYGLQQATELSREEAARFISAYFEKYPGVKNYLESMKVKARESGYVQTLLGRKRFIPEINSPNRQVREAAERMAINMPVQGTSADIIKVAMINLYREIEKRQLRSKMLLQVHDELVFEVSGAELEIMRQLVPEVMSAALTLSVPLKVDVKIGKNWGEME